MSCVAIIVEHNVYHNIVQQNQSTEYAVGNFSMASMCPLYRLVQLQRGYSATGELIIASQTQFCLKLIDLRKGEIRPYSKFMENPSEALPLMKYEQKFTELLNATFAGPTGKSRWCEVCFTSTS